MNIEKLIRDTFTAHEHVVPDRDAVLAAARRRIERRRPVLTRPLAVAAGVAALTMAAVTVVALNRPGSTDTPPVGAPAGQVEVSGTASGTPAVADLRMPYALDWLPPGEVDYMARRINIGGTAEEPDKPLYGGEYMLTVKAGGQALFIDVQHMRMVAVDDASFKSGPGAPVTINGRRGVESTISDGPGGYELYVEQPDGGSMYVHVSADHGSTAPAQQLIDVGRRIAQNIRFPGTATVTPAFGLRDLPGGLRVCAFDVEKPIGSAPGESELTTAYSLGTCDTQPSIHVHTAFGGEQAGTPGEPVQGHATNYVDEGGYLTLQVLDAVHGEPVVIAGRVPLTDLYAVADSLVLPG